MVALCKKGDPRHVSIIQGPCKFLGVKFNPYIQNLRGRMKIQVNLPQPPLFHEPPSAIPRYEEPPDVYYAISRVRKTTAGYLHEDETTV